MDSPPADASPAARSLARRRRGLGWCVVTGLFAIVAPQVYIAARTDGDLIRLEELTSKSRWGEAERLAYRLAREWPERHFRGTSLQSVAEALAARVRELETSVASPPSTAAPLETQLTYARTLAMLGREDSAIRHIEARQLETVEALNLLGTIHETRSDWPAAEDRFRRAAEAASDPSIASPGSLQQAVTGLAYALRKQGRYPEAEETYLRLWSISATPDTAFLLARFYEDTQQFRSAERFVRRAMTLDPARYTVPGQHLLETLQTRHFGCFLSVGP